LLPLRDHLFPAVESKRAALELSLSLLLLLNK
jgi:hypothetical protein